MSSRNPIPSPADSYLPFPCVCVPQGQVTIYVGALQFGALWPLCTVSPREPRQDDPLASEEPRPKIQTPQRISKDERVNEIADYVEERLEASLGSRKEAIFPGTVILGLLADVEESDSWPEEPTPTAAQLIKQGDEHQVWLPKLSKSLFIIDGQHRLKGLAKLEERLQARIQILNALGHRINSDNKQEIERRTKTLTALRALKIPISLLVDFDLAEQAMVFATVNFKQKTVSRSFYFDIFGAFESDRVSTISFAHDLVLHLNNSTSSPLHKMIKLLGTGPGLVSQAFFGSRIVLLIDPELPKSVFQNYFRRRQKDDKDASRQFAGLLRNYFSAVRAEMHYAWPVLRNDKYSAYGYNFILCKSMATSGLLSVFADIYRLVLLDFAFGCESEVASSGVLDSLFFRSFLSNFDPNGRQNPSNSDFARGKPWSIGGSAVIEKRIYQQMRQWMCAAYKAQILNMDSQYNNLIKQYKGPGRIAGLIRSDGQLSSDQLWVEVEKEWTELTADGRVAGI